MSIVRVLPWGETLVDLSLDGWTAQAVTHVEILVHTKQPDPDAVVEFFTCPTKDMMRVGDLLGRCDDLGLKVILNLDPHLGNGRDDCQSVVEPGKYHKTLHEGGYREAVDKVLSWPRSLTKNVVAFQWLNEPKEHLANWIAERMRERAGRIRARGWLNVISAKPAHLDECAQYAQVLDPHELFETPAHVGAALRELQRDYPKHQQWVTELLADTAVNTAEVSEAAIRNGAEGVSVFGGHSLDDAFNGKTIRWNDRNRKNFVAQASPGVTLVGKEWNELWGIEDGGEPPVLPPVEPPEPPPPLPPEPGDDPNWQRVSRLNVEAREALENGRPNVAERKLKRQAGALGIE